MKKDWMIWAVCGCLFGAGAVWGQVVPDSKFFHIENIHDFAEIIAAFATTVAVGLAMAGLNSWRHQAVATSNHELARRVAIALQKYRLVMPSNLHLAGYVAALIRHEIEPTPGPIDEVKSQLRTAQDLISEVRALAMECGAVWGKEVAELYEPLFELDDKCQACLRLYLNWARPDQDDSKRGVYASVASKMDREFRYFAGLDNRSDKNERMEKLLSPLDDMLAVKLLR